MKKERYDKTYVHYDEMMDAHNMTGRLFSFIPFYFNVEKYTMAVFMSIPLFIIQLVFSLDLVWSSVIFALFILFNMEYNRVYALRDKVAFACIWNQLVFEDEIRREVTQLPDAPNYIDHTDINIIFEDAIYNHKKTSYHIFNRMFNKMRNIFR